jgi:hypothetical protein
MPFSRKAAAERQNHAPARADRSDRERLVHLPESAPWLAQYLAELTTFPNGRHDDQVDSTAQMLDSFKGAAREPGFLGYYRMLAQKREAPGPG